MLASACVWRQEQIYLCLEATNTDCAEDHEEILFALFRELQTFQPEAERVGVGAEGLLQSAVLHTWFGNVSE